MDQSYWRFGTCAFDGNYYHGKSTLSISITHVHFLLTQIGCLVAAVVGGVIIGAGELNGFRGPGEEKFKTIGKLMQRI